MMSSLSSMQGFDLNDTIGAAFIGTMVSLMLFGITCLQSYYYFQTYPKDGKGLKIVVLTVWVLDILHSALICQAMYYYLVTNYNNPQALAIGTNTLWTSMLANLITSAIVQCFFTRRIFILAGQKIRWPLVIFIGLLALLHVIFGLITITEIFEKKAFRRINELVSVAAPFAAFAVLADFAIAISLCILLHNRRTGFRRTSSIISTLIIYAINRCLLTSAAATVEIIVLQVLPKTFWFLAIDFIFGKLYANSLLATLNTRRLLRDMDRSTSDNMELSGLQWGSSPIPVAVQTNLHSSLGTSSSEQRTQTVNNSSHSDKERNWDSPYVFEGEEDEVEEHKVVTIFAPSSGQ